MDFLIFYEHVNRELENIMLIKKYLEHKGFDVSVSHFSNNSYGKHILFSRPKVVLTPWLRNNENVYRFSLFKNNPKIINLQWEQLFSQNSYNKGYVRSYDMALRCRHICWGQKTKKRLISEGCCAENVFVGGALQLDFCRKEFANYYYNKSFIANKYSLNVNKRWVLFISSFSFATYGKDNIIKFYAKYSDISEFVKISIDSRKGVIEWFKKFKKKNPDIEIIYRLHPSEKEDEYLKKNSYNNFHVISEYSVKQWIKVCDTICNWYSTSLAEVIEMKKEIYILRPIKINLKYELEIMVGAKTINTYDEFEKIFKDSSGDYNIPINMDKYNMYYSITDLPAYVRISKYLIKVLESQEKFNIKSELYNLVSKKLKKKYTKQIIISLILDIIIRINIKISRFFIIKKNIFKRIEEYAERYKSIDIKTIENKIEEIVKRYDYE